MAEKAAVPLLVWATSQVMAWIKAQDYRDEHAKYAALTADEQKEAKKPKRDLELETLAGVLNGEIIIHMHCYRADEMLTILDLAKEFDYKVGTFHHGVHTKLRRVG